MNRSLSTIASDGVVLTVDDWTPDGSAPERPTLLMLHGGGQTRHSWHGAAQRCVDRGHRVVTADLRGHGDSTWHPAGNYEISDHAGDAAAVIDWLGEQPVLIGASLGGITGMVLEGALRPGSLQALVLVDIVPRMSSSGVDRIRAFMREHVEQGFGSLEEAAAAVAAYNPHRARPATIDGLKKNLREQDGRWFWHWDPATMRPPPAGAEPREVDHVDRLANALHGVAAPTMLVRGRQSDLVDDDTLDQFVAEYPHIGVADVSGAGHMVAGDRNDVFSEAIESFIEQLP